MTCFVIFLILASFAVVLINQLLLGSMSNTYNTVFEYARFILGYGDLIYDNLTMHLLLGIAGVFAISILSAKLTIDLLWRNDVIVDKKMLIVGMYNHEKVIDLTIHNNAFELMIPIENKGNDIFKLDASLVIYDEDNKPYFEKEKIGSIPLLRKSSRMNISIPIELESLYKIFRDMFAGDQKLSIYCILQFFDSKTNQANHIMQVYDLDRSLSSMIFREKGESFHTTNKDNVKKSFVKWVSTSEINIDLSKINITNTHCSEIVEKSFGQAKAKFDLNEVGEKEEWLVAYLSYINPCANTSIFCKSQFQFDIKGKFNEQVEIIFEVKDINGEVIRYPTLIGDTLETIFVPFNNGENNSFNYKCVKEICFSIDNRNRRKLRGWFEVKNLKLSSF